MAKREMGSEEDIHGKTVKRKRPELQLTSLPTEILCCILSQLPIQEAVRTSILSEQWRYLWRCHSNLAFSIRSMLPAVPRTGIIGPLKTDDNKLRKQEFIQRVDAVLEQHNGAGVDRIQFRAPFDNKHRDQIERWVNFSTASKAKQIIFDFSTASDIRRPCNFDLRLLDDSKSLGLWSIKLCSVSLKVPADFKGFQNLKWIYLADTNITDGGLQRLMSNCSVFEFLGIAGCAMLTRLQISHPSNTLKQLQVYDCCLLQEMELNFGLARLEYRGPWIVLSPPGTLLLTNMCIKLEGICTSLEYIFTKLRDNVPRLEILNLKCQEYKMTTLPGKLHEFVYLKHLILELTFESCQRRMTDILQFACLLVAAPFSEKLEFHMWLCYVHERYSAGKWNSLRSLPSQPHSHLRSVDITGFYGEKDQLELALHILRDSVVLQSMKVDPSPVVTADLNRLESTHVPHFVDGYEVAREFLCSKDRRNVVHVVEPLAGLGVLRLGASADIIERVRCVSSPRSLRNSSAKACLHRVKRVRRVSRPASSRGAS